MAKQSLSTLKNWFRSLLKPTQQQFWDFMDSFWHKDENIPASKVENLQSILDGKINVSEKGAPGGVPVLDGQSKILTDYIPALAITDLHIALQQTLFDFCQYEWETVSIQKGDLVQITSADEVVEIYQLYDGSGSHPSHYKMINVSKIDWTNVLNKPNIADPANVLALDQTTPQTLTDSPIISSLTPGALLVVGADRKIKVLTGLSWDAANNRFVVGEGFAPISGSYSPNVGVLSNGAIISGFDVVNSNPLGQVRLMARNNQGDFIAQNIGGSSLTWSMFGLLSKDISALFQNATSDTDKAMIVGTINAGALGFGTSNAIRLWLTATGNLGVNKTNASKKLHVKGTAGYESVGDMGGAPEDFTSKFYVDGLVQAAIKLQADWNADTNTPDITGVTTTGHAFRVIVPGNTNLGGITDWLYGELAVKIDTGWMRIGAGSFNLNWGLILGDIANQTDLMSLLDQKADIADMADLINNMPASNYVANGSFKLGVGGWGNVQYSTLSSIADSNYISGYKLLIDNGTANVDQIRSNAFYLQAGTYRIRFAYQRNGDNGVSFKLVRSSNGVDAYNKTINNTSLTVVDEEVIISSTAIYYVELYCNGMTDTSIGDILVSNQLQAKTPKNSIQVNNNQLQLVGDSLTPGNSKYYGTNASGTKGFHPIPSSGSFVYFSQQNNWVKDGFFYDEGRDWGHVGESAVSAGSGFWSDKYLYVNNGTASTTFTTPFDVPLSVRFYCSYQQSNAWAVLTLKIKQGSTVLDTKTFTGDSTGAVLSYVVNLLGSGNVTIELSCNDGDSNIVAYGLIVTQ